MADGALDARLIVELEARIDKLQAGLSKGNSLMAQFARSAQTHADTASKALGGVGAGGLAKSLDKAFDESRFSAIRAGGLNLRLFGSALEPLGALGIAAGLGIGAFALSLRQAQKALDWSEALTNTAAKIGVTTSQLQELDFAATGAGIDVDTARESIEKLNEALGRAQTGGSRAKVFQQSFQALGIGKDQLKSYHDAADILPVLADRLKALYASSPAEAESLAKRLGVDELLPELLKGGAYIRGMAEEARNLGVVMGEGSVHQAAELAGKVKIAKMEVDAGLRRAFIDLGPIILGIVKLMAKFAQLAGDTAENMAHIKGINLNSPENVDYDYNAFSKGHLERPALSLRERMAATGAEVRQTGGQINARGVASGGMNPGAVEENNRLLAEFWKVGAAYHFKRNEGAEPDTNVRLPVHGLLPDATRKGGAKAAPDEEKILAPVEEAAASAAERRDAAEKALDEALKGLTTNIDERAAFEKKAIVEETAETQAQLAAEAKKVNDTADEATKRADKDIAAYKKKGLEAEAAKAAADRDAIEAKRREALADITAAQVAEGAAAIAKQLEVENQARAQHLQDALRLDEITLQGQKDGLVLQEQAADTRQQRKAIQLRLLDLEQQELEARLKEALASPKATDEDRAEAARNLANFQANRPAQEAAIDRQNQGPLANFAEQQKKEFGDLNDDAQTFAVEGIQAINNGLIEAAVNFRNFGDIARSVLRQLESDLLRIALNKFESTILNGIFGGVAGAGGVEPSSTFAGASSTAVAIAGGGFITGGGVRGYAGAGKIVGPGSGTSDSILARVSNGESVNTAKATGKYWPLIQAMNTDSVPGYRDGGLVGSVLRMPQIGPAIARGPSNEIHFHLDHPVVTQDLLDQMNEIGNASMNKAVQTSLDAGRRSFLATQTRSNLLQG